MIVLLLALLGLLFLFAGMLGVALLTENRKRR